MSDKLKRLAELAGQRGVDALAVMPGASLRYFTGLRMPAGKRLTLAFFPNEGKPSFVIPELEAKHAKEHIEIPMEFYTWHDSEGPYKALQRCIDDLNLANKTVAVEYFVMRVLELRALEERIAGVKLVDSTDLISSMRASKDESELAAMREAVRMIETALERTLPYIKVGKTEREIADIWEKEIKATGSEGFAFGVAVAGGPNGANPHNTNSDRPFEEGDLIVLDGGAVYKGYLSDITRTFALGTPSEEAARIYNLVKDANAAGRAAARPGATGEEVDAAARKVIEEGGYGKYFIHRTGHGLGLEVHEPPFMVQGNTEPLVVGNTFTVEPGIYVPGVCGVRIEDDMVITADGAESLTTFERELIKLPV